jgi:hypothetical protein
MRDQMCARSWLFLSSVDMVNASISCCMCFAGMTYLLKTERKIVLCSNHEGHGEENWDNTQHLFQKREWGGW